VVRTLSDRADDSAHHDFVQFVKEVASQYSAAIVSEFLRQWPHAE
jgi:adenosylhomocysteine nucleosidase